MSMPKTPNTPMPEQIFGQMQDELNQVGMNPAPFEQLIRAKGIRMIHQKPLPCPNQRTLTGGDHDPNCDLCYNGYLYYDKKEFIGAFTSNSNNRQFGMTGTFDMDQATMIVPSKDIEGNEMDFQFFDQIMIPDFTVRIYQRVKANQTGLDRLHYPATRIDKVVGPRGEEYFPGIDCIVNESGMIKWISQNRPGYDLEIDSGVIYSVNYYTAPRLTIIGMPHQLRVTQTKDKDGNSVQARFPQLVIVRKDFVPYQGGETMPEPQDGQV